MTGEIETALINMAKKMMDHRVEDNLLRVLNDGPPPDYDEVKGAVRRVVDIPPDTYDRNPIMSFLAHLYPDHVIHGSGIKLYPQGGGISWHTNSNAPGKRIYLSYSWGEGNYFRHNGPMLPMVVCTNHGLDIHQLTTDISTSYDKPGCWSIREFDIPEPPDLFWHCVYCRSPRLSIGFRILPKDRPFDHHPDSIKVD